MVVQPLLQLQISVRNSNKTLRCLKDGYRVAPSMTFTKATLSPAP